MKQYCVHFIGDYFNLTTLAVCDSVDEAVRIASENILYEYGWNVAEVSNEINAELEGEYAV